MLKKLLVLLCVTALMLLSSGLPGSGTGYAAQGSEWRNHTKANDVQEGTYEIDLGKVVIADNFGSVAFAIQTWKPFSTDLLAKQSIWILINNELRLEKGPVTRFDRAVEIRYINGEGLNKLVAVVWEGNEQKVDVIGHSEIVTHNKDTVIATIPMGLLGYPSAFSWQVQVVDIAAEKLLDSLPDDGPVAYIVSKPKTSFVDVLRSDWYYPSVAYLTDKGVAGGYADGTFKPQKSITRAEFCKMVLTAVGKAGEVDASAASSFTDAGNHWAKGFIEKAKELGIVNGYAGGEFRPNSNITRAEIAKMICAAKGINAKGTSGFQDCGSHWADSYIAVLKSSGIIGGYSDGTFKPANSATRAEVCKILSTMGVQ